MSLARNSGWLPILAAVACTSAVASPAASQTVTAAAKLVVIRGDAYALRFYPVGRIVRQNARICLPAGALYLTLQKSDGGTVNYGAPGCNKLISDAEVQRRKIGGAAGVTR